VRSIWSDISVAGAGNLFILRLLALEFFKKRRPLVIGLFLIENFLIIISWSLLLAITFSIYKRIVTSRLLTIVLTFNFLRGETKSRAVVEVLSLRYLKPNFALTLWFSLLLVRNIGPFLCSDCGWNHQRRYTIKRSFEFSSSESKFWKTGPRKLLVFRSLYFNTTCRVWVFIFICPFACLASLERFIIFRWSVQGILNSFAWDRRIRASLN